MRDPVRGASRPGCPLRRCTHDWVLTLVSARQEQGRSGHRRTATGGRRLPAIAARFNAYDRSTWDTFLVVYRYLPLARSPGTIEPIQGSLHAGDVAPGL